MVQFSIERARSSMVEQLPFKEQVVGSNPSALTLRCAYAYLVQVDRKVSKLRDEKPAMS